MVVEDFGFGASPVPTPDEMDRLAAAVTRYGRATLLVPGFEQRDVVRCALAEAGLGLAVDVTVPAAWLASLWELLGDGRHLVEPLERQLLMANVMAGYSDKELKPLVNRPGTVRLLARMASDLLPYALDNAAALQASPAERVVLSLLSGYADALDARGLVEPASAAEKLRRDLSAHAPACARATFLKDIQQLPAHVARLLGIATLAGRPVPRLRTPDFLGVTGPHAKAAAYAREVVRLASASVPAAGEGSAAVPHVVVATARPAALFDEMADHLVARDAEVTVRRRTRFDQTVAGAQFLALRDLAARMREAGEDLLRAGEWWPAPELTDWLYSPLSGADVFTARQLDKKLRSDRSLTPQAVQRMLQSAQGRVLAARGRLEAGHPLRDVPCVCSDAVALLLQDRPIAALRAMLSVAEALPAYAFGSHDGGARAQVEVAALKKAIEVLLDTARKLDVPQAVAATVLDGIAVASHERAVVSAAEDGAAAVHVTFMTPADASLIASGDADAILFADVDIESYPLSHDEGPVTTLAERFGTCPVEIEPAERQRAVFARALAATEGPVTFARVTHDRQTKDRYAAAVWTEALNEAAVQRGVKKPEELVRTVDEGDVLGDFYAAGTHGFATQRVTCLPPTKLSDDALPYLVLRQRDTSAADPSTAPLVPRQLSASQIESYLGCPLCWFMSSRVRPQQLDAGFGNMEMGNFVHDVLYRLHAELIDAGIPRVTRENLGECLDRLRAVFAEERRQHERGKTSSSAPLIPHSVSERLQVDQILPQLEAVIRYEAGALAPFAPAYLEYSFNGLGVEYAGRPLGGRIDRVDVDAEGRAVVIDYKHRADVKGFNLVDPTVAKKDGTVPADDPDWLPTHTQSLIYAQALRHSELALDSRGALYFSTKGGAPAMRGAVSAELAQVEPDDGRVPGLEAGFPDEAHGGSMAFDQLLDRVEDTVRRRLDALEAGDIRPADQPAARCAFNHSFGFERRDA